MADTIQESTLKELSDWTCVYVDAEFFPGFPVLRRQSSEWYALAEFPDESVDMGIRPLTIDSTQALGEYLDTA